MPTTTTPKSTARKTRRTNADTATQPTSATTPPRARTMTYSHLNDFPADVRERAAKIRLAVFDVDGTLTDGRIYVGASGGMMSAFHVLDGMGLNLLRKYGVAVALVSARQGKVVTQRARELGIKHTYVGVKDKLKCIDTIGKRLGVPREEMAYMGDDLNDLRAIESVGLGVAPANAHPWVRERAHWRTRHEGGNGAAREVCDLILAAREKAEDILKDFSAAAEPAAA
jgi:3-deoxy-D-manno-octulosonate 8-phosphate phosphatase (KDO 8-P phosphatase)